MSVLYLSGNRHQQQTRESCTGAQDAYGWTTRFRYSSKPSRLLFGRGREYFRIFARQTIY
jgi:hypothetical protein